MIRARSGRFLKKKSSKSTAWYDVGNTKAREKSSQALREGAPELRNFVNMEGTVRQNTVSTGVPGAATSFQPAIPLPSSPAIRSALAASKKKKTGNGSAPTGKASSSEVAVGVKSSVKPIAFLQAMEHYKNLYGKPKDPVESTEETNMDTTQNSESKVDPTTMSNEGASKQIKSSGEDTDNDRPAKRMKLSDAESSIAPKEESNEKAAESYSVVAQAEV